MKDISQNITNRYGLRLFVRTFIPHKLRGLVFLAHGLSDNHATQTMLTLRAAYIERGYGVVVWDATHSSWGQSEGSSEKASFTKHYQDLEDIIEWARDKEWFREPIALAGYSLGGTACGTYASRHPNGVHSLVLVAPVVSGRYLQKTIPLPIRLLWQARTSLLVSFKYRKRYSWGLIQDGLNYDLIPRARNLTMPVLIIGAGRDVFVRPKTLKLLYQAIPHQQKKMEIVSKSGHKFLRHHHTLHNTVVNWLNDFGDEHKLPIVQVPSGIKKLITKFR